MFGLLSYCRCRHRYRRRCCLGSRVSVSVAEGLGVAADSEVAGSVAEGLGAADSEGVDSAVVWVDPWAVAWADPWAVAWAARSADPWAVVV